MFLNSTVLGQIFIRFCEFLILKERNYSKIFPKFFQNFYIGSFHQKFDKSILDYVIFSESVLRFADLLNFTRVYCFDFHSGKIF